jgi:cytochrome c2
MRSLALAAALSAMAGAAIAQDGVGNPTAGRAFAREVCTPCHVVASDQLSPRRFVIGPDFQSIAKTPGMTETALQAFLMTWHPRMPNLILTPQEAADVIAYISSLREHQ